MKIKLYKHEEMLLALLRSSLTQTDADVSVFESLTLKNWKDCYKLAETHGVKALAWDGLMTLPRDNQPPKPIYISWAISVQNCEKIYEHHCKTIANLTAYYARYGILTMQMKGVGFSIYYPHPEHREGGDIDIFTRSADLSVMDDVKANKLANELIEQQGIKVVYPGYKHSVFVYDGVEIENHKCFLNVKSIKIAGPIEKQLFKNSKPIKVGLLGGKFETYVPNDIFNTLFISFHAMQHVGSGICLHHICDWFCILKKCGMIIPEEIKDKHYHRALSMFNTFASRFLGADINTANCSEGDLDKFFWLIMRELDELKDVPSSNIKMFLLKCRHFCRYVILRKIMLGESVFTRLMNSIWLHLRNPHAIFNK